MAISASERCVLILRTILYGIIVISSFLVFGALAASMSKHDGKCLLFAEDVGKNLYSYREKSTCDYSIAVAVIFCLVCPVIVIVVTILTFIGILKDKLMSLSSVQFIFLVFWDALSAIFVLVAASIISAGFKQTCETVTDNKHPCSTASVIPFGASTDHFYSGLAAAEGGAWSAFFCYLVQVLSGVLVLWRTQRLPCQRKQPSQEPA